MTDYTKTTDFTSKDSLPSGDSGKIIRGAEFGTEFDNIQTAVNSKSNIENPVFTGTITGNGSGITNVAAASIDLTVSSDTDADYNVPFMNATGDGGSAKVLQVDDNGLMFNPNSNTLSVNRLKGSNDNLLIQDTSGNTILDIDANALEIPVNTTITGTTAVTGNITVTGTVDGRDIAADGTKLDTVETNADVTDTANVTAAGALMDSELTDIAAVKALNQGVATTDSPTFAGATVNGTVEFDGLSGTGAVTVTDILDQDDMSSNSATALATQQSIKSYVDSQVATSDTLAEVLANGNATGGTDVAFGDNDKALFGAGSDLQIYHDGLNSYISDTGTGNLRIRGTDITLQDASGNGYISMVDSGAGGTVFLKHLGNNVLATTSTGIDVTGTATMDGLKLEAASPVVEISSTSVSDLASIHFTTSGSAVDSKITHQANTSLMTIDSGRNATWGGKIEFVTDTDRRMRINNNGDISFYEDTGTTASLVYTAASTALKLTGRETSRTSGAYAFEVDNSAQSSNLTASGAFNIKGYYGNSLTVNGLGDVSFYDDSGTAKFFWDASTERLGIGNAAPVTALDVTGTATMDGLSVQSTSASATVASFKGSTGFGLDISVSAVAPYVQNIGTAGGEEISLSPGGVRTALFQDGGDISFYDSSGTSQSLFWDASAKRLGLGLTNPSQLLHLKSSGPDTYIQLGNNTVNAGYIGYNSAGDLNFWTNASTRAMTIDSSSNVGIGTDSPESRLSVLQSAIDGNALVLPMANTATDENFVSIRGKYGVGNEYCRSEVRFGVESFNVGSGFLSFATGTNTATERMRIDSSGNLLVGTTDTAPATNNVEGIVLRNEGHINVSRASGVVGYFNRKTNDGTILDLRKDGLPVGSIGVNGGNNLNIGGSVANHAGLEFVDTAYYPQVAQAVSDAAVDIGGSSRRYKDLYLSGDVKTGTSGRTTFGSGGFYDNAAQGNNVGVMTGGNQIFFSDGNGAATDNANDLGATNRRIRDAYVGGGVYLGGVAAANKLDDYEEGTWTPVMENVTGWSGSSGVDGTYTKIGNTVHVFISMTSNVALTGTPTNKITGLPFSSDLSERCSNVSVSRMFGIGLTTTDYIAGVAGTEIIFSYVNSDNNVNNLTHSGSTLRFTLSATYTTAS